MNMTPMIVVTFLLLIFFMTVTQVSEINREPLDLPKQAGSTDQEPVEIVINITHMGDVIVAGERVTMARLTEILNQQLAAAGGISHRVRVALRVDERGTSEVVNEVVELLNALQLSRVHIAVQVPQ